MGKSKRKPGSIKTFKKSQTFSMRLEWSQFQKLKELAETQTLYTGKEVTMHDLIRGALTFTFDQNELLREFFRRRKQYAKTRFRF